jgi:hypothetical protein
MSLAPKARGLDGTTSRSVMRGHSPPLATTRSTPRCIMSCHQASTAWKSTPGAQLMHTREGRNVGARVAAFVPCLKGPVATEKTACCVCNSCWCTSTRTMLPKTKRPCLMPCAGPAGSTGVVRVGGPAAVSREAIERLSQPSENGDACSESCKAYHFAGAVKPPQGHALRHI